MIGLQILILIFAEVLGLYGLIVGKHSLACSPSWAPAHISIPSLTVILDSIPLHLLSHPSSSRLAALIMNTKAGSTPAVSPHSSTLLEAEF